MASVTPKDVDSNMRFIRNISARTMQRDETPPTGAAHRGTASHCGDSISRRRISGLQQDVVRRDQWLGKARQLRSWSAHAWKKADRSLGRTPWRMESSNSCRPRATTMSGNERARVPARHIWNSGLRKEWKMEIQDVRLQMKCSPFPTPGWSRSHTNARHLHHGAWLRLEDFLWVAVIPPHPS